MENHPIKAIMDLSHLVRRATEQQMADLEISSVQSRVLGYLWWKAWKKEPAFQKELEAEFKIRRSSVCSVVQCLEKRGLLERRSVSTDARQKELVLTDHQSSGADGIEDERMAHTGGTIVVDPLYQ